MRSAEQEACQDVEAWCVHFIETRELSEKVAPGKPPRNFRVHASGQASGVRIAQPGRPPELTLVERSPQTIKISALVRPEARAELLHRFWHHELQAAELFAWAILAFPETPEAFRAGLLGILLEEVGHMQLYAREIERLGFGIGAFAVRDWFWQRVPTVAGPAEFVALVGLGLEGANLDHAPRFAAALAAAGDDQAARIEARVGVEEERHVAFAALWFERFTGAPLTFENWQAALPAPLTPRLFRGKPLNGAARERSGMDAEFVRAFSAWRA